ncbi:MAG: glycosyltransferase family A protein [Gillisia sp.]
MKTPLISVIIPTLNIESYISATIESVLAQSYDNLEVIIVDGGSKDKTLDLLNKYKKNDSRLKIISAPGKPLCASRNIGLSESKGKYIKFFDGDDILSPFAESMHFLVEIEKAPVFILPFHLN